MIVWVEEPTVAGDRVVFRWRQSTPNPFQRANEFFFRYEGLDLSTFSPHIFTEIFLALQLKVFAGNPGPVQIVFTQPVAGPSAAYWQAFHGAEQVTIGPIAGIDGYEPQVRVSRNSMAPHTAAIFYGGGKDSMLATGLLSEVFGSSRVLLIQYVAPLEPSPKLAGLLERRFETQMLKPIRDARGVTTQRVWTDYQANFTKEGYAFRPHLELYTAGALPVLVESGVRFSSFGSTRTDYPIFQDKTGARKYIFARSRPEMLATLSTHYQSTLGLDHTVTNINFPYTTVMDTQFLYMRYPELLPLAVMCTHTSVNEHFCYRCSKCFNYAVYSLAAGYVDPSFDYQRVFLSPPVLKLVDYANSGVELSHAGNAPWKAGLTNSSVFQAICHALAKCDPARLTGRIDSQARANLFVLIAMFGNRRFENQESVAADVVAFPNVGLVRQVGKMAAEHFPVVDQMQGPWIYGHDESLIDFQTRMPTATALLPHIQRGAANRAPA